MHRAVLIALFTTLLSSSAFCQFRGRVMVAGNQPGAGGVVNLPYLVNDNAGSAWRIYQGGWLQQQGNVPVYSQGATYMINGGQPAQNNNQARLDDKTGELVMENMVVNGFSLTRRIFIDKDNNYVRYVDILKNTQQQDQQANIMVQTNLNFGINNAQMVADPKKKDHNIGWVAQTGAGPSAVELFGGRNAKVVPTLTWPQGNNYVQANLTVTIPAGKSVALMHLHATAATQDAGVAFINKLDERQILKSLPAALRQIIVNFATGQGFIGETEILRGDLLDVVELRTGDQFRGTLKETAFDLQTFYGAVSLPMDKIVGLINVGQFHPRQLLITADGQIFGGTLKKQTLDLQLSSGQVTQIPLGQISRAGYRKRAGEPDEWNFEGKPLVMMRTGERVGIQLPTTPVDIVTRYGKLSLGPDAIAAVLLQNEENGVHQICLTDGSKFAGLLSADEFTMKLDAGEQTVKFPTSAISRLQLAGKVGDTDDLTPTMRLGNDDLLVGMIVGKLKLNTAFDTITVSASEIRGLTRADKSPADVQIVLWDGTTVSGEVADQQVSCRLLSGVTLNVPVALIEDYNQPQPQPSPSMVERIKLVIKDLDSNDWKQRDRAQATLTSMGPVAMSTLKQLRNDQPPEAQKAIDAVLKELEKQRQQQKTNKPAAVGPAAPAQPQPAVLDVVN